MSERDSEKLRGVADWVRSISIPDIDELVNRFLTWPVPASVRPDGTPGQPGRTGTNLMTAAEAKEMLLYVLASAPQASQPPQGAEPVIGHIQWSPGSEPSPELRATLQEMVTKAGAALAAHPQGTASPLTDDSAAGSNFEQELRSGGRWSPEMIERVAGAEPAIFNAISAYTPPGTHSATASPFPAPQEPALAGWLRVQAEVPYGPRFAFQHGPCTLALPPGDYVLYAAPAQDSTRGTP